MNPIGYASTDQPFEVDAINVRNRDLRQSSRTRLAVILLFVSCIVPTWAMLNVSTSAEALNGSSPGTTQQGEGAVSTPLMPQCGPGWSVVAPPDSGQRHLFAVDAVSSNDVWAVGNNTLTDTLAMHWDGNAWSEVPAPNVGTADNVLDGVAAVAADDAWAVGYYHNQNMGDVDRTLILHWDGSVWSVVPSPNSGIGDNYLRAITALSGNDVWAVGYYRNTTINVDQTLILHGNGNGWTTMTSPNAGTNTRNRLYGVAAASASDAWAVGSYGASTLTERWNGSVWSVVPSPNAGTSNSLNAVAAVANMVTGQVEAWAVGTIDDHQTLTMHWNGSSWSVVPSPNVGTLNSLMAVTAVAVDDMWAVGSIDFGAHTLILWWDGNVWSVVPSPDAGDTNLLFGAVAVAPNDVWAVGYYQLQGSREMALMEHYNPCSPSPTPTATRTHSISTATPTLTPASTLTRTNTPRATNTPGGPTATACPIQFTDVLNGSTFYQYIRCLACRGIVNGYTSGCETGNPCFRPSNNVTRGQLSKIVANAAGFSDPAGAQQYQDLPPNSTFYDYVWQLSDRGYVSGYECGGADEPCVPPNNLPYFRPDRNASRGQISKIVSNAAGFVDLPGDQVFEDVPPSHTFYDFVQRLASRTIIGGYICGGAGEPCLPPNNRPYFRSFNNASRGQTSKIVANTFLLDCQTPSGPGLNK
ncbi:MAG TPA: S-layer homology domain-containing protein [Chloroflexia bacterium]|nr:S-layer homology domain-containing protein [Chloroflexia bacterium]